MMGDNAPDSNSCLIGITDNAIPRYGPSCKFGSSPEYKPKMNITLGGSTYTKTIDLGSQDLYNVSNSGTFGSDTNGLNSIQIDESSIVKRSLIAQRLTACNEITGSSSLEKIRPLNVQNDSSTLSPRKTHLTPRSTFFSRLARRLTIRRTGAKLASGSAVSSDANFSEGSKEKLPSQIPTGRQIRRWLSKYLIPPKNSPLKSPPDNSSRPATLEYSVDKRVSQLADNYGSVPTRRRGLPSPNLLESSLCNSRTGTISLVDEPLEVAKHGVQQGSRSYGTGRLNSENVVASVSTKQDNPTSQLFSAFSSPSVVAIGPPPRYLSVSLAAFGYTGFSQKWVSAQTLQHGNTSATKSTEPASTFPQASMTPQRHKSTSLAVSPHTLIQRPQCLDLHDDHELEASSTPQASVSSPVAVSAPTNNSAGVTIRVKCNCSNSTGVEGDKSQDQSRGNHSHHENWNRSSLIMLAVAQASPRSHNASSSTVISATTGSADRQSLFFIDSAGGPSTSPTKAFSGRRLVSAEESSSLDIPLPKLEEVPNADAIPEKGLITSMTDLEEASSPLTLVNGHAPAQCKTEEPENEQVRDGHYFLRVAECTAQELRSRADEIELDLKENDLSDDVSGHLRTTMGKVNLLLSKKFAQFRGLCMDSIEAMRAADSAGEFVTLPSDLEGFWAMVMLQVDDVRSMIDMCDRLKQNGWQVVADSSTHNGPNSCLSINSEVKRRQPKALTENSRQNKETADIARLQARERLKAAKLQYKRACRKDNNPGANIRGSSNNISTLDGSFIVL